MINWSINWPAQICPIRCRLIISILKPCLGIAVRTRWQESHTGIHHQENLQIKRRQSLLHHALSFFLINQTFVSTCGTVHFLYKHSPYIWHLCTHDQYKLQIKSNFKIALRTFLFLNVKLRHYYILNNSTASIRETS